MTRDTPNDPTKPRTQDYEEIEGTGGREVFFRPQRYGAADLAPILPLLEVIVGDDTVRCAIDNVSQMGIAFELPTPRVLQEGSTITLTLDCAGHRIYAGNALVQWLRVETGHTLVGASFNDLLDLDEVLALRDVQARTGALARLSGGAWSVPGNSDFKAGVSELALLLEDARGQMTDLERHMPFLAQSDRDSPSRKVLVTWLDELASTIVTRTEQIDTDLRRAPATAREGLQEYSQRHLQRVLLEAPWMNRAFHKPLGYPGDFHIMNYVYSRDFEGQTLFARALHYAFLQVRAAEAVRARKDLVKAQLHAIVARRVGTERPVRILSIAAGPAQELYELLAEVDPTTVKMEIVLFEQDQGALAYAHRRLRAITDPRWEGRATVTYLRDSIKRLLRDSDLFAPYGTFDAIVCSGFFDYLRPPSATSVARTYFRYLAPEGVTLIGNMAPENPTRWLMEQHLDWHLIHRSREEMIAIGAKAAPAGVVTILEERTGVNPFLAITKPA